MGTNELAGTELRDTLKRLRKDRAWSMARMSELLNAKGLTTYATTVAKIESGERAVQIDELVTLADIFDVTTDALLGRTSTGTGDKSVAVSALINLSQAALWGTQDTAARLSRAVAAVDGFKLTKQENTLRVGCANACAAMADVIAALDGTMGAIDFIFEQNR